MITVRSAALTNFERVAAEYGLDAHALVEEVGLPYRCLVDPDLALSAVATSTLLETAALRAHEPAFGLRLAASRRLSNLGPLGLLLRDQPTLRHALETLVTHIHTHNAAMTVSLLQTGPWVSIREETLLKKGVPSRQATELAMATTFRLLRIFLGENWLPHSVTFRHVAPPDGAWHRRIFGCPVRFGQEFNEIVCSARDLEAPNPGADPVMARYSQRLLEADQNNKSGMVERVRHLMVLLLPRGHCRIEVVAQHLGVDRRTVANHLAKEGTSYSVLLNQMRLELLENYLHDGSRQFSDIATLLGFSELSAFCRWHRAQFGVSATRASS
ncbi:AraC family transcriptional regulator [Caballeronia calidae]|uniref:AraC family transcriptional regulator n=1 Tax=Caballeronia calidae TaxID=1777139 RepID=A0A158E9S2_9BURK|nr:AraC family transcriptional regulator [Caballeronia calidae]SAL03146.1 AraC family transcriptional regulator [Caballeronia calidae]